MTIPLWYAVATLAWADPAASTLGETAALTRSAPSALGNHGNAVVGAPLSSVTPSASGLIVPVAMPIADEVIVHKAERRLELMKDGRVLRSYRVRLGLVPEGPKERAGDFRTPEGRYYLVRRNPRSDYFLSIQVSYPNPEDVERARREHVDPGGSIMIHGRPNTLSHQPGYYAKSDWTDGCIALSDSDMVEVWLMTRDNTPIDILP
ncbi:MAG TPA: L,D-transpeptidase family protein [Steroidobacteraceae bacterium]|nr:L,D-transpeptidase family protein [Steroidobacteraceae bacterium]